MSALSAVLRQAEGGRLMFWCPGCKSAHGIQHGDGPGPRWTWNGDAVRPTFNPSVLVRWHQWTPPATDEAVAAKIRSGEITQVKVEHACHSFVRDGQIQYLGDCTHELAGQTVPLVRWNDEEMP